ncbi:MAG: ABC transporter substrate-binding protein [Alphaproteobacteria bacterium]|nr:ABC transporter substrate-binding protein [Alphaproteobacteria bacterium]
MRRREFITLVGSTAAWPVMARAQQAAMPVVGYLSGISASDRAHHTEAFRQGLNDAGYAVGHNVFIEYRYADNQMERLRPLAADLISRKVAVIAAVGGNNTGLVAKTLTSTIPIVFTSGRDPVNAGLVASLNRPEANVTGVIWFSGELGQKQIELLQEFLPRATLIGMLVNPNNPEGEINEQTVSEGARVLGRRLLLLKAGTASEIDAAFATFAEQRANAVIVGADPFYPTRARQLAVLAARHGLPMISAVRELPVAGGLISYGNSVTDAYRRVGVLAGRLLKGAKPADMPVDRATKFELVINLGTAKALGLVMPPALLARADEVIE